MGSETATAASSAAPSSKLDMQLNDVGDGASEGFPRRLLKIGRHIVAYGGSSDGSTGNKLVEVVAITDADNEDATEEDGSDNTQQQKRTVRLIREYDEDEGIRAVAVSPDGKRVAVGFESGLVLVHKYDSYDATDDDDHPFVAESSRGSVFSGPNMDQGTVRDLKFHPASTPSSYRLAVATESGLWFLNVESAQTVADEPRYLHEEVHKVYGSSGIRGVSFGKIAAAANKNADPSATMNCMATLGMDGRLCLWDVSSASNPADWRLIKREEMMCITKPDRGEMWSTDPYDRSCRPLWTAATNGGSDVLALPGETYLQLRTVEMGGRSGGDLPEVREWTTDNSGDDEDAADDGAIKGHIESIVALTASPNPRDSNFLVSSGRDGRVFVWNVRTSKVRVPSHV